MRTALICIFILAPILFISSLASAQSGYAGGFIGYAQPDLGEIDSELNFGIRAGGYLSSEVSLGAYLQFYRTEEGSAEADITPILAELNYYFFEVGDGAYISGKLGLVREKESIPGFSETDTESAVGIGFGGDFPINEKVFLNGEINYIMVMGDPEDYSILNFNGFVGFRF